MHKYQLTITEIPSFEYRRCYGQSNLHTFRDGWRVLRTILRERSTHLNPSIRPRYTAPIYRIPKPISPTSSKELIL
jgi:hypothetical protein